MTVLVTGGTGFLGGSIVQALLTRGERVRVLARSSSDVSELMAGGVEIADGDLTDQASILSALEGCDTLYYVPPLFSRDGVARATQVTHYAMQAAMRAGTRRVIYTSGTRAVGHGKGEVGNEATVHRGFYLTENEQAKVTSERVALSYHAQGLPVIVVSPAMVYGPREPWGLGRYLTRILNGETAWMVGGRLSWLYIDDVGIGHLLAAERGLPGHRYILSESVCPMDQFYRLACRLAGTRPVRRAPDTAVALLALANEVKARLGGRGGGFDWSEYREYITYGVQADGTRAVQELGMVYTPLEEGLRRTIRWHWQHGLLRQKPDCV